MTTVSKQGNFFGEDSEAPDIPLEMTLLKDYEDIYHLMRDYLAQNGWFRPCVYYLNYAVNKVYSKRVPNSSVLHFPVLFIEAKFDRAYSTSLDRLSENIRNYCSDLTETSINAGH